MCFMCALLIIRWRVITNVSFLLCAHATKEPIMMKLMCQIEYFYFRPNCYSPKSFALCSHLHSLYKSGILLHCNIIAVQIAPRVYV